MQVQVGNFSLFHTNFCLKVCSLTGKVKRRVPFSQGMPHCWPSRQKLHTLISHEERHAVRRWDHWHEQLPSLQTAVLFISLWQEALIDKPQQAAALPLLLYPQFTCPGSSWPQCCSQALGGCCDKIQWEFP